MNLYENYIEAVPKPFSLVCLAILERSRLTSLKFKTQANALKQFQFFNASLR